MKELILIALFFVMFGYAAVELFQELATVRPNVEKIILDSYHYSQRGE